MAYGRRRRGFIAGRGMDACSSRDLLTGCDGSVVFRASLGTIYSSADCNRARATC